MLRRVVRALRGLLSPSDSVVPLQRAVPLNFSFAGLTKGIDNIHFDVRLSPQFVGHATRIITSMMEQHANQGRPGQKSPGPTSGDWEQFRTSYARMVEGAVHRDKVTGSFTLVPLVQFAVMAFLLQYVQGEIELMRQGLRASASSGGSAVDSRKLEHNERMSWFARNRARIRYRMNRQLFDQLAKVESGQLGDLRQSLLDDRWPVPQEALCNPLLQAETPFDDEVMTTHYVLLGQDQDDAYSFAAIDRFLAYLFRQRRSDDQTEMALTRAEQVSGRLATELERIRKKRARASASSAIASLETRKEGLEGEISKATAELDAIRAEYLKANYAWADVPANVTTLFDVFLATEQLRVVRKEKDRERVSTLKAQIRFQRSLLDHAERAFVDAGLLTIQRDYSSILTAQQLHQLLRGNISKKDIVERLQEMGHLSGKTWPAEPLIKAAVRTASTPRRQRREYLVRFLKDFLTCRRDLSYYHLAQDAMNLLHVLEDPKDVRLSQTNKTLYEFLAPQEEEAVTQTILNHVILKADVRGSTTVVAELRKRNLNPASHFSQNLFDPIHALLETYGASKVFIEGDAVILSFFEYQETQEHRLCVARACGLAKRLLSVLHAQNSLCRKGGLPELELGIGLAFGDEAPAFLYDGDSPIMISSAIGKADRLSSCSWLLRKQRSQRNNMATNVEVYELPDGDPLRGEKGETHLRYNVNGIELDPAGFVKLQSEITLQRLELPAPGDDHPAILHTGRYPDLKGTMQRLVIREGSMRLLDLQEPNFGKPTTNSFYEVVTDEVLLNQVDESVKTAQ